MDPRLRLVLLSFLMLFVELALIRWTGSNVLYLGFFSNFILLGSFLGIGIGFLRARSRVDLFRYAPLVLALYVLFVLLARVEIDRSGDDLIFFGSFEPSGLPVWVMLPVIFLASATVMAMIAEGVARTFALFPPLDAYRLDIVGSILGIVGFSALSFAGAPPVAWGLLAGALFLVLIRRGVFVLRVASVVALVVFLGRESLIPDASWSPYYKVRTAQRNPGEYHISVNSLPHQAILSTERRRAIGPIYFVPYERLATDDLNTVLIVGAGTGSDVAIALDAGAGHVDAVEIDPKLQQIGSQLHPDRPYQDPRVRPVIDDGRAFLERADETYDLILFALPDSLTLVSGQSSLRLESYLFTRQAMATARDRLAPDGVFSMYNYYREDWLIDRLARTLDEVYGHPPCVDRVGTAAGLAALTIGLSPEAVACATTWTDSAAAPAPVSDDYPFLYLREPGLPGLYLVTLGLILVSSVGLVRLAGARFGAMAGYTDLFLMGAAFLLLETKSVVQFALLFGTTWFVNALVFAGILLSVLAAIEVTRRVRLPAPPVLYGLLLATVLLGWVVVPGSLLGLPFWPRFIAAVMVWFTPIFLANLVFAQRFRATADSTSAFGANLLGAMVGGLLEYAALSTGYQALALLVAVLYAGALIASRLMTSAGGAPRPA